MGNSCHNKSDGRFCSGKGKGRGKGVGGMVGNATGASFDATVPSYVKKNIARLNKQMDSPGSKVEARRELREIQSTWKLGDSALHPKARRKRKR